ncbi:MAG: carbonic anhydrase [Oligoflexus sp.]
MAQRPSKTKQAPNEGVTPSSLVTSILISCPVFALMTLREVVYADAPQNSMLTMFLYLVFGLVLAFFWRRLNAVAFKHICTAAYLVSLWLYMGFHAFALISTPGLMGMINIAGLAVLAGISCFTILAWMLSESKNPSSLLLSSLGLLLVAAFTYRMIANQNNWPVAKSAKNVHVISSSDYEEDPGHEKNEAVTAVSPKSQVPVIENKVAPAKEVAVQLSDRFVASQEQTSSQPDQQKGSQDIPTKAKIKHAAWSYAGKTAPHRWPHLSRAYRTCGSGQEQSPIDIPRFWRPNDQMQVSYQPSPYSLIDLGHTLQVNLMRHQEVRIGGQIYKVEQIQFRSPSEHLHNGKAYPLEIQIAHRNERGELAILGVMAKLGKAHPDIDHIWRNVPSKKGLLYKPQDQQVDIQRLIPQDQASYTYVGSITTPPCREGVKWNVFHEKIEISSAQLQAFRNKYQYNARPPQALNFR